MNQFEFDSMTAERLETYIMCQTESTDLEKMLIARLIEIGKIADDADNSYSSLEDAMDEVSSDLGDLEEKIIRIEDIAKNEDDAEKAIEEILAEIG